MSVKIGRLGILGLGIENTAGTAVPATTAIPFITNTLHGKHQPQEDIPAVGSRVQNRTSIIGKQWGEGEVDVNVDLLNVGFLLKLGLGNETITTVSAPVYDHLFYTTVSGNTPTTATLYNYQGVDIQQFASMAIDKIDFDVKDSFMTAKAGFKGFFPTSGAYTNATVSGTLINFANYSVKFGSTIVNAVSQSASPLTEWMMSINNNAEVIHESGQPRASRVAWKQLKITGSYTKYFETVTERDAYLNLNKTAMVLTCSGNNVNSYQETMTINLAKCVYTDQSIATGLENFFAVKTNFTAEFDQVQAKQLDIVLRNTRSSLYT